MKIKKSSSHSRLKRAYLSPSENYQFIAYQQDEKMSQSKTLRLMVREFFRNMPEHLKERYRYKKSEPSKKGT